MRYVWLVALLTALSLGCAPATEPLLSHGQPVSHWITELQDRDPVKRKKAVTALGNAAAADPATIPAIAGALKDPDARVRAEAALALLHIGPAAQEALPALEEAQQDKDATVRSYVQKALERIRGKPS